MNSFKGFTNTDCKFYPCHDEVKKEFNCLFCYCPLIAYQCPGPYKVFVDKNGFTRKDCSSCKLPHDGYEGSWRFIQRWLSSPLPWDGREQSIHSIRYYNTIVNKRFDENDIKWAEE